MPTSGKTVTAYFIRHGETYLNLYGKMQGWADAPLTESGTEDARATGRRLANTRFDEWGRGWAGGAAPGGAARHPR